MIYAVLYTAMIYQACGLDKKIRILANADFLVDPRGIEPLSENPFSKLSTSVFGPIISLPVVGPTKIGGGSSFIRGGYKSNSPLTFTAHLTLQPESLYSRGKRAAILAAACH